MKSEWTIQKKIIRLALLVLLTHTPFIVSWSLGRTPYIKPPHISF